MSSVNERQHPASLADRWLKSVLGSASKGCIASLLLLTIASVQTRGQANPIQSLRPTTKVSTSQPISFEENKSSADAKVKFVGRGLRHSLLLTKNEAVLTSHSQKAPAVSSQSAGMKQGPAAVATLGMKFSGANPSVNIAGEALLPGKIYHADAHTLGPLSANDTFRRVKYSGIYTGVDALFYGTDGRFEFDFVVAPHADPNQIRLTFSGAEKIRRLETGEISLQLAGEDVRLKRPTIYQENNGIRREIEGGYTIRDGKDVTFTLGDYDAALPLTIDPLIVYGTYVGSSQDNGSGGIAVNQNGETYMLGLTNDATTLQSTTTFPISSSGSDTGFLTKISADGSTALYTIIFSGISDFPIMAVDSQDNVQLYLGGPDNALRTLSKDSTGALTLGLFHGSFVFPNGPTAQIKTDSKGNAYLVIFYQPGDATTSGYYLFKVDPNGQVLGTQLIVHDVEDASNFTFENVTGLAVNNQDQAFVIGMVGLSTIAATPNAFQSTRQDTTTEDIFAMQIDTAVPNNFQVRYATYLGGSGDDRAFAMGISSTGAMLITGMSSSTNFPTTPNTFQPSPQIFAGGPDTFLVKLDPTGQSPQKQLVFSTWLGHQSSQGNTLVVLPGDLPTIAGTTPEFNFPLNNSFYDYTRASGASRSYVATFSADGSKLLFSSFLDPGINPGTGFSIAPRLETDGSQFLYVSTITNESGQGTTGAFQPTYTGGTEFFLRKIDLTDTLPANNPPQVNLTPSVSIAATSPSGALFNLGCGSLISCSYVDPDGDRLKSFTWTGPNGFTATASAAPPSASVFLPIGSYSFTLAVQDVRGGIGTASALVNVLGTNTDPGSGTIAPFNDDQFDVQQGLANPVTVTFDNVTSSGLTWVTTRVDQNPAAPVDSQTGLPLIQAGSPPMYFDVHTSAGFSGVAHVCVNTQGMSFADPADVQVYEVQSGNWVALSTTPQGSQLCADTAFPLSGPVDQLSTMAIFYPPVPTTVITTIAGNGFSPGQKDDDPNGGANSQDNFVDGGPAVQQAIGQPFGGAVDVQNKFVYFSSTYVAGGALYKLDLNTGTVSRIAGTTFRPFGNGGVGDIPSDGMSALQYPLNQPGAVAVDSFGNVYIAEHIHAADNALALESCAILKLDIGAHTISRIAGSQPAPKGCGFSGDGNPATNGLIGEIRAIALDIFGHMFLADADNHRVRRVDAFSGTINTVAGDGGSGISDGTPNEAVQTSLLGTIGGLAFDSQSNLVISESHLWRLAPSLADGLVDGQLGVGELLTPIQQCGFVPLPQCKPLPFGGDGGPVGNTTGAIGSAIIVASDGSIVTVQDQRVRQALPGTDQIVTGNDSGEIIQTIAGYEYDATLPQFGGNGTTGAGFFNGDMYETNSSLAAPAGVLQDPRGGFLILDTNNRRIRRIGVAATVVGTQLADIAISASASPDPVNPGDVLSYGTVANPITITNFGPSAATGVMMNFLLPSTANFESVTTSQGTCSTPNLGSTGTVNCNLGAIVNGGTVTLTVAVRPQSAGPLAATLSVLGSELDPNSANNIVNLSTQVNATPVTLNVSETISVTDAPNVQPSVMINTAEAILVTDVSVVTPQNFPPVVTPPGNISIGATEFDGARGNVSGALHNFLLAGTAVDGADPNPQRLTAQANIGGSLVAATDQTIFPIGPTQVTFSFRDAGGLTGTANATVTVAPAVGGSVNSGVGVTVTPTDANNVQQPIQLTFGNVTQPGLVIATLITPSPTAPTGTKFINSVFDIETTALFVPPITVCFTGSGFLPGDQIWHNGVLLTTTVSTSTMICAQTPSLSPFGVVRVVTANNPPSANAGPDQIAEATSSAGAQVTLSGKGTDPDNDPLTFAWTSATCGNATGQIISLICPLGVNTVSLTVSDGRGGTATDAAIVTVRDTTPPALKLPANITVEASGPKGTAVSYSASAIDLVSGAVSPVCSPASGSAFPLGSTTVKCTASDAAGNTASGNFTVTSRDTTPPSITITPSQVTVIVNSIPATRAALGLPSPVVSDLVDPNPRVTDNAPSTFSTGAFAIVFTATDASGNKSTTTLNVNVQLRFASFTAEAIATQVRPANSDLLAANLSIQLGKGNNGINFSTDSFHLQVTGGAASLTIDVPFNKYHAGLLGSLVFSGSINDMPTDISLIPAGTGRYDIVVGVAKASLAGLTNPLTFNATLGSDTGQVTTAVVILKK
jgi:hypothetical protein